MYEFAEPYRIKNSAVKVTRLSKSQLNVTLYHTHTVVCRVSVVRTTFKVYGKVQTLTLSQPKTPEPIVTKF